MDDVQADHDHAGADCREAVQQLYFFLDGELTAGRRARIGVHLESCSHCLEAFDFEAELRAVIHQRCRDEVPGHLRQRIASALEDVEGPLGPPGTKYR